MKIPAQYECDVCGHRYDHPLPVLVNIDCCQRCLDAAEHGYEWIECGGHMVTWNEFRLSWSCSCGASRSDYSRVLSAVSGRQHSMTTPSDWLLAQIAEDEAVARAEGERIRVTHGAAEYVEEASRRADPFNFARVLAECGAKRRIVEQYVAAVKANDEMTDWEGQWVTDAVEDALEATLRALALPYADRPGYREEWAL